VDTRPTPPLLRVAEAVDDRLGDALERQVARHHSRRLRKLGHEDVLAPGPGLWAAGEPPPRAGNELELLVDGATALPRIAAALRAARSHVTIAGWEISPDLALTRSGPRYVLRDVLAELAERLPVRVLLWAGAPLPVWLATAASASRSTATNAPCTPITRSSSWSTTRSRSSVAST